MIALLDMPETVVAVVGATDHARVRSDDGPLGSGVDPEAGRHLTGSGPHRSGLKYGGIIYRDLRAKGVTVRAVNPYRDTVAGDPCWRSLADLPEAPTIVNIVVPPTRTLAVLEECSRLGLMTVWIQPGAADDAVHAYLEDLGFTALVDACIMVPRLTRTAGNG
jgi:predicted CoA-binding protein